MPSFNPLQSKLKFTPESFDEKMKPWLMAKSIYDKDVAENEELSKGIAQFDPMLNADTPEANKISTTTKQGIRNAADWIGTSFYNVNRDSLLRAKEIYNRNMNLLKGASEKNQKWNDNEQALKNKDSTRTSAYYTADGKMIETPNIDNFLHDRNVTTYAMSGEQTRTLGQASAHAMSGRVVETWAKDNLSVQRFDGETFLVNTHTKKKIKGVDIAMTIDMYRGADEEGRKQLMVTHPELKPFLENPDLMNEFNNVIKGDPNFKYLKKEDQQYQEAKFWEGVLQGLGPADKDEDITKNASQINHPNEKSGRRRGGSGSDIVLDDIPLQTRVWDLPGFEQYENFGKDFARCGMSMEGSDVDGAKLLDNICIQDMHRRGYNWDFFGEDEDLADQKLGDMMANNPAMLQQGFKNWVTMYKGEGANKTIMNWDEFREKNLDNMMAMFDKNYHEQSEGKYYNEWSKKYNDSRRVFGVEYNLDLNDPTQRENAKTMAIEKLKDVYEEQVQRMAHALGQKEPNSETIFGSGNPIAGTKKAALESKMKENARIAGAKMVRQEVLSGNTKMKKSVGRNVLNFGSNNGNGFDVIEDLSYDYRGKKFNIKTKHQKYTNETVLYKNIEDGNFILSVAPDMAQNGVILTVNDGEKAVNVLYKTSSHNAEFKEHVVPKYNKFKEEQALYKKMETLYNIARQKKWSGMALSTQQDIDYGNGKCSEAQLYDSWGEYSTIMRDAITSHRDDFLTEFWKQYGEINVPDANV